MDTPLRASTIAIARRRNRRRRRPPGCYARVRAREERALLTICAEAEAEGRQVVVLGPAGILEVTG